MNKGGGYVLTAYMLEIIGPDEVLTTYLCDSVRRSLRYDDRATAITWAGQILAALRDYADRSKDKPKATAARVVRDIARRLSMYVTNMMMEGDGKCGQIHRNADRDRAQ